jgi:hypothetical protein
MARISDLRDLDRGNLCAFMRLIIGRNLLRKTLHEDRQKHPFGLEEVAARMLFEAERPKFLMSEREQV